MAWLLMDGHTGDRRKELYHGGKTILAMWKGLENRTPVSP